MDKRYMLLMIDKRIAVLQQRYQDTINNRDGDSIAVQNTRRANIKRDLQVLKLLRYLLLATPAIYIEDDDAIDGFDKLVTPVERHRRLKKKDDTTEQ